MTVTSSARAGFIGGVDNFNGSTLDPATWATSTGNTGTTFTQNNALTIHSNVFVADGFQIAYGGYTTLQPLVPVGGSAWAEVKVNSYLSVTNSISFARLTLTTDPTGVQQTGALTASTDVRLDAIFDPTSSGDVQAGADQYVGGFGTSYGGGTMKTSQLVVGSTYIFQIERLTSSATRMSLFSENGPAAGGATLISLVGTTTETNVASTSNMYVFLEAIGTDTTYDRVTINQPLGLAQTQISAVPEPATIGLLGIAGLGLLLPRRRAWNRGACFSS